MHDQDRSGESDPGAGETAPGEFDHLLRQIEKEPVPERLLALALELQAALVERRNRSRGEEDPGDA